MSKTRISSPPTVIAEVKFEVWKDGKVTLSPYDFDFQYVPVLIDALLAQAKYLNTAYSNKVTEILEEGARLAAEAEAQKVQEALTAGQSHGEHGPNAQTQAMSQAGANQGLVPESERNRQGGQNA